MSQENKPAPGTYVCPHCGGPLGKHYHPTSGPDVCCLKCSGFTEAEYEQHKLATDPKYMAEGKDHATWPASKPWPWPQRVQV